MDAPRQERTDTEEGSPWVRWWSIAFLILLAFGALFVDWYTAECALAKKVTELEAAGIPTTLEEVDRRYHEHGRDPAENAAPIYERAFAARVSRDLPIEELGEAFRLTSDHQQPSAVRLEAIGVSFLFVVRTRAKQGGSPTLVISPADTIRDPLRG